MDKIKRLNEIRSQKAQAKKVKSQSIGKALTEARKQPALQRKSMEMPILVKGPSEVLPSKVSKVELQFSPLKRSRETRGVAKCGYNSNAEAYTQPIDGYNPCDAYALQNLGTLESFLNTCCAHVRDCGCKGMLKFVVYETENEDKYLDGTLFSSHTVRCSDCGTICTLESDYFERKPNKTEKMSCFSRISRVCGIASKNMSWIFAEMQMLFACLGVVFFSVHKFQMLRDNQGAEIIKLAEEVVDQNLEREMEMVKCGKGLPQGVQTQRFNKYTVEEINGMRSDQLKGVLEEVGFPSLTKKEERLEAVKMLLFETDEEKMKEFMEKHGDVDMCRLDVGGDGSWAFRSYNNNVKSPYGQAALIGACTKSVIAWGHRVLKCYICSRAKNSGKDPKPHDCQINHSGTVKSMESEIILECFQKLLRKNCVVAQIALDGDSTTLSLLQKTLIKEVAFRVFGGEVIVDMKADDRHLNKTIKIACIMRCTQTLALQKASQK